MKNLISYIKESLLDNEDVLMKDTGDKAIKNEILKFLKDNYKGTSYCKISKKPINGKYIVDCNRNLDVKNRNITSLTNEYFEFGVIGGYFDCSFCNSLTSLKGSPEKVGMSFNCPYCNSLTSLEGGPKEVGENFYCAHCNSLKSLEGAPKEVEGFFYCFDCNSLTSLKGAPKEVGGGFYCFGCKTQFTIGDVEKVSKVRGNINC